MIDDYLEWQVENGWILRQRTRIASRRAIRPEPAGMPTPVLSIVFHNSPEGRRQVELRRTSALTYLEASGSPVSLQMLSAYHHGLAAAHSM